MIPWECKTFSEGMPKGLKKNYFTLNIYTSHNFAQSEDPWFSVPHWHAHGNTVDQVLHTSIMAEHLVLVFRNPNKKKLTAI